MFTLYVNYRLIRKLPAKLRLEGGGGISENALRHVSLRLGRCNWSAAWVA
jgi:hypothetical protein